MIFDALRRRWVRYFRPGATSVSPKFSQKTSLGGVVYSATPEWSWTENLRLIPPGPYVDPHQRGAEPEPVGSTAVRSGVLRAEPGETANDALQRYVRQGGRLEDIPGWGDRHLADEALRRRVARPVDHEPPPLMLKPPSDPAVDRHWPWSEWLRERAAFSMPGWTYCRFPIQFPGDRAVFVFGMVRESFGVYHTPFNVVNTETQQHDQTVLACMVHMRTGCGMGLFVNRQVAAQACELAEKVETRWGEVDPQDQVTWSQIVSRVGAAWRGAGILPAGNYHAYDDVHTWSVYGITTETMMQGRPEKLS